MVIIKKIYQLTLCLSLTAVTLAQKLKPFSNRVFYWGRESIEFVFWSFDKKMWIETFTFFSVFRSTRPTRRLSVGWRLSWLGSVRKTTCRTSSSSAVGPQQTPQTSSLAPEQTPSSSGESAKNLDLDYNRQHWLRLQHIDESYNNTELGQNQA